MNRHRRTTKILGTVLLAALDPLATWATNGMNLEGYGPVSVAMGGSSLAFDNGTAAVMNNPATLALAPAGTRLDLALGNLGPKVRASVMTPAGRLSATSQSDAFYMPAIGVAVRRGRLTWGLGIFGQGGMGTQFGRDSWLSDPSGGADTALDRGLINRTEVSVGRVILPLVYTAGERVVLAATADLVWAGMDLQMGLSEAQFQDLADPRAGTLGRVTGSLVSGFGQLYEPFGGTGVRQLHHAYFDFSNGSPFTGQARGYGVAGKVGALVRVTRQFTVGAVYHGRTRLGDLETSGARLAMDVRLDPGALAGAPTGTYQDTRLDLTGTLSVRDFQWPAQLGLGAAFTPTDRVLLAVDVKRIYWSAVMSAFQMTFVADRTPANGPLAGLSLDAALYQRWQNQTVIALGGAVEAMPGLTLRAGYNHGRNPVPDRYLNALFPATVEGHATFGAGYRISPRLSADLSVARAFDVEATNGGNGLTLPVVTSRHRQLNWQALVSRRF